MEHPEYPGFTIQYRLLIDDLPLLVLDRGDQRTCISEGRYRQIIEFVMAISSSAKEWLERPEAYADDINYRLHRGFITEEGWAEGEGIFYGHLVKPDQFAQWLCDPDFVAEMKRYERRTGKTPQEPFWDISVSSGSWRGAAKYLPKSSVEKIIAVAHNLHAGEWVLPDEVQVLSEDEWDERFGWAASTGLRPSLLRRLESYSMDYLEAQRDQASDLEEKRAKLLDALTGAKLLQDEISDALFYQLRDLGLGNLKTCIDEPECLYPSSTERRS